MDEMSIGEILKDFRSIKLPTEKRDFINRTREYFQSHGSLPMSVKSRLKQMVKHYSVQFEELHASRARARKTNWRRRGGITLEQAERLVRGRREQLAAQKSDLGF